MTVLSNAAALDPPKPDWLRFMDEHPKIRSDQ
jgi:hypothetical protein